MQQVNGEQQRTTDMPVEVRAAMGELELQRNGAMTRAVALAAENAGLKDTNRKLQAGLEATMKRLVELEARVKAVEKPEDAKPAPVTKGRPSTAVGGILPDSEEACDGDA